MTSIKDVAREVDMSTATVSRALRGLPGVSEETRERVMETARRLGYVPSPSAAGLATGQTRTVAVIVPFVTQWFFAAVVQGAEEVLRERGYDLLLYNLAGDASARHRVFETNLLTKRVDAVLVLSLKPSRDEMARLTELGRPVTVVGADLPGWSTVRIDDEQAASTATQHLIDLGHERIAYIGGATEGVLDFTAPSARLSGYRQALKDAGLPVDLELESDGDFTVAGGLRAGHRMLSLPGPPDRSLRGVGRDGHRRPARGPRSRAARARGRLGRRHRRPRDGELLRPHHGGPAGPRAGTGRRDPGAGRAGRRRLGTGAGDPADPAHRPSYDV